MSIEEGDVVMYIRYDDKFRVGTVKEARGTKVFAYFDWVGKARIVGVEKIKTTLPKELV